MNTLSEPYVIQSPVPAQCGPNTIYEALCELRIKPGLLTVPDVLPFVRVLAKSRSPERIMHDGNHDNASIDYAAESAYQEEDHELFALNLVLRRMTGTQRSRLHKLMWQEQ